MALQSKTTIDINGTEIKNFKFLELRQSIKGHHTLEIVCRMDVLETIEDQLANTTKEFLGEVVTLEIEAFEGFENNNKTLSFKGVVTQIHTTKGHELGKGDEIVITAKSPDFIANDGPHFASHSETSLSGILNKTFEDYDTSKLELDVRLQNDPTLHYSVQQNESAYVYASRLAAQYGEWLYYDGGKLVFGEPDTEELELTYGFDLREYQLSLMPQSNNYKMFTNDYLTDQVQQKATSETSAGLSGFGSFVSQKSGSIYTKETRVWHSSFNDPQVQQRLDTAVERQKKAIEVKQVKVNGTCDNPGVKLGSVIVIEGNKYRVTTVRHTNNEVGDYSNRFEAIIADINTYPYTNINAFPKSETQAGIVKENADPYSLGRVKVQFPWQEEDNEMTPWIRIVTPHGGGDKGFHFIPEIDEKVLIGFEGGNAEHPYVLGALYTGSDNPSLWSTQNNDIKAIKTRSEHLIEFNDSEGGEYIKITDRNKNSIEIDTVNNNITISCLENMTLRAKNIDIEAEENLNINVGENKNVNISKQYNLQAKKAVQLVEKELQIQSKEFENNAEKLTMNSTKENMELSSAKQVVSNSSEKNVLI